MVSKAADKSSKTRNDPIPLPIVLTISIKQFHSYDQPYEQTDTINYVIINDML